MDILNQFELVDLFSNSFNQMLFQTLAQIDLRYLCLGLCLILQTI